MRAGVTLGAVLCVLTAGCGSSAGSSVGDKQTAADMAAMDKAYATMLRDAAHPGKITADLHDYAGAARLYAGQVGADKASEKLAADASSIRLACPDCAVTIKAISDTL